MPSSSEKSPVKHQEPHISDLRRTVSAFKDSLKLSDMIKEIEQNTREQRLSPLWFSARQYRITASQFGRVLTRKDDTPPDCLVLQLIHRKSFTTPATRYGIATESLALSEYVKYQQEMGILI